MHGLASLLLQPYYAQVEIHRKELKFEFDLWVFRRSRPVILIPLVITLELIIFHALVWERTLPASQQVSSFSHPLAGYRISAWHPRM